MTCEEASKDHEHVHHQSTVFISYFCVWPLGLRMKGQQSLPPFFTRLHPKI